MTILNIVIIVLVSLFFISLVMIVIGTVRRRGVWGINLETPLCPDCGVRVQTVRVPTSLRQGMWGGWTCTTCGCEMDKWGKRIDIDRGEYVR